MNILKLIGRDTEIFTKDISNKEQELTKIVSESSFLVIGGAGSIGQAVTKEIFKRNPLKLHVVDISENNMVELVRDLRSSFGYIDGDFQTFALDIGSIEYDAFIDADRSRALEKKSVSFEEQIKVYNSRIQFVLAPHVDIGFLFVFAIGSLGVYGVILGGWSSNNKYSLLGSLRSSAQLISYEIPLGLSVLGVVLVTGSLNLERIIQHQVDHGWNVLFQPLAMVLFATSIFAECNRLPFDLPESEQELVGGYHTEYSSMKFALFLFGEYTHMITTSFLMMTVFFGAWHLPFITDPNDFSIFGIALKFAVAAGKTIGFIIFYMLIRWTILRFRFDQLQAGSSQLCSPEQQGK